MQFVLVTRPTAAVTLPGELASALVDLNGVNWERELALILDLGEQRTGGYAVQVLSVDLAEADQITVTAAVRSPGPGEFVAQVFTHPFTVVRLPRVGLRQGPILIVALDPAGRELARQEVPL